MQQLAVQNPCCLTWSHLAQNAAEGPAFKSKGLELICLGSDPSTVMLASSNLLNFFVP